MDATRTYTHSVKLSCRAGAVWSEQRDDKALSTSLSYAIQVSDLLGRHDQWHLCTLYYNSPHCDDKTPLLNNVLRERANVHQRSRARCRTQPSASFIASLNLNLFVAQLPPAVSHSEKSVSGCNQKKKARRIQPVHSTTYRGWCIRTAER